MTLVKRRRLPADERRRGVLDAASTVFGSSSYRGATMAEIAREAGISEPILYRHYGSKCELYLACLDEAWREFRAVGEAALAADPKRCLGAAVDAYMASEARVRLVDLWIQALSEAAENEVIAAALKQQIREVHALFADFVRRGQALGELHPERDPVAEAWIFVATGLLATVDARLGGLLGDDLQRVRAARRRFMHV